MGGTHVRDLESQMNVMPALVVRLDTALVPRELELAGTRLIAEEHELPGTVLGSLLAHRRQAECLLVEREGRIQIEDVDLCVRHLELHGCSFVQDG